MFETNAERRKLNINGYFRHYSITTSLDKDEFIIIENHLRKNGNIFPADFLRKAIKFYLEGKDNVDIGE